MAEIAKLGNAEFRSQVEAAAKGLAEASDGLMSLLKQAKVRQTELLADAAKLSVQYGIHEEMIALQQALKVTPGGSVDVKKAKAVLDALAQKVQQEGHPIRAHLEALKPELEAAAKVKDPAIISKTIGILVGEKGLPKGPIRDLIAVLQKPLEQAAEHGVNLAKIIENEGKLSPAKQQILKTVAATHLPKVKNHIATLEGLGMALPEEARGQLAKLEQKLVHGATANMAEEVATAAAKIEDRIVRMDDFGHAIESPAPIARGMDDFGNAITGSEHTSVSAAAPNATKAATTTSTAYTSTASSSSHSSSYSGSSVSHTPSTTVSSEGRQWYQWLTHEVKDGKAVFSGGRTAIAAGAAAAVAGGIYLLKRDKDDDWRSRTSSDHHSTEAAR